MSKAFGKAVIFLAVVSLRMPATSGPAHAEVLDVTTMDVAATRASLLARKFTAEDVLRAHLRQIERYNSSYNAFTSMNPKAIEDARAIDRRIANGEPVPPLAGIPVAIKESVDVAGLPSTAGWKRLSKEAGGLEVLPERDAPLVARLRAAGAVILGKTNIPAFSGDGTRANSSWAGPTFNAVDRALAPGASSSGSATAVAAGFSMVAIAEETGGSIQDPSAAQGIVGIRPTFGLVPNIGVVPVGGSTRDVLGSFGRTVSDAAAVLDVIAGYSAEDPKTVAAIGNIPKSGYVSALRLDSLKGKRVGLYGPGWRDQPLSPETQELYRHAQEELKEAGAVLVADPFDGSGLADLTPKGVRYDDRGQESVAYDLQKYLEHLGPGASIHSLADMRAAIGTTPFDPGEPLARWASHPFVAATLADPDAPPDFSAFRRVRESFLSVINTVFRAKRLDALVFPQMFKETPRLAGNEKIGATTVSEIDIAGLPAVTVPAGTYRTGSPFSLIFVGPMWSEARVIGMAYAYEQATMHRHTPNLIAGEAGAGDEPSTHAQALGRSGGSVSGHPAR